MRTYQVSLANVSIETTAKYSWESHSEKKLHCDFCPVDIGALMEKFLCFKSDPATNKQIAELIKHSWSEYISKLILPHVSCHILVDNELM